jgi:gliding motility-associated lipoprotein GldD
MTKVFSIICFLVGSIVFLACGSEEIYTPKPRGFNRIDLPSHSYKSLEGDYPYSFEYSQSAVIQKDTFARAEPYWIIIYYPELNARIQLTYKPLNGDMAKLQQHIGDSFKLAAKHQVRATSQKDQILEFKNGNRALVMKIEGEVPSHFQFITTDSTKHFLRGATYLMEPTINDSLKPVVDFVKRDCERLLETLTWKQ